MRSIIAKMTPPEINQTLSQTYTVITDLEGVVLSVNDTFFATMEMPREELFNRPFISLLTEHDLILPSADLSSFFHHAASFEFNAVVHIPNKKKMQVRWTVTQLHAGDQQNKTNGAEKCQQHWTNVTNDAFSKRLDARATTCVRIGILLF